MRALLVSMGLVLSLGFGTAHAGHNDKALVPGDLFTSKGVCADLSVLRYIMSLENRAAREAAGATAVESNICMVNPRGFGVEVQSLVDEFVVDGYLVRLYSVHMSHKEGLYFTYTLRPLMYIHVQ